jgi:hypothetical protein
MARSFLIHFSLRLSICAVLALIGHVAAADTRLALLIPPATPSTARDLGPSSEFSELALVPFHNARAIHTYSDKSKKFVFIYCTEPGKIKTIAISLPYGTRLPEQTVRIDLPARVSKAALTVRELDGRVEPFVTSHRSTRTYHVANVEYKTDIILQFSDDQLAKLKEARSFEAVEEGFDISVAMNFDIYGSREPFDRAFRTCVSRL